MIKDYPKPIKVRQNLQEHSFVININVAKLESNLISLTCKVESNMVFYLIDLRVTKSFKKPSVVEQLG
jgi:hypothetical protein